MLWEGPQKLMVSDEEMRAGSLFQRITWTAQGIGKLTSGEAAGLPYSPADWYWKPSRAIQPEAGNEITEFPFFTFIYADLHAHLMALPLTLLGIAWALAALFSRRPLGDRDGIPRKNKQARTGLGWLSYGLLLLLGALVYGALRPTNTWDQYTYLALGCIALAYGQWLPSAESPSSPALPSCFGTSPPEGEGRKRGDWGGGCGCCCLRWCWVGLRCFCTAPSTGISARATASWLSTQAQRRTSALTWCTGDCFSL